MADLETAALLLRAVDYGEADKVCTFLTASRGKLTAFARGARGSKKRFRGGIGAFVELEISLRARKPDSMASLTASEAVRTYPSLGADLHKMAGASHAFELIDRALQDEQGAELFVTVVRFLRWMASEDGGVHRLEAGLFRFQLLLLNELGLLPDFSRCARTGDALDDETGARWLPDVGVVTPQARHPGEPCGELPRGTLDYLQNIASGRFPDDDMPGYRAAVRTSLIFVWRHIGGRDLKSYAFYASTYG